MIPNYIDPIKRDPHRAVPHFEVFDIESNNWTDLVVLGHYDGKTYKDFGSMKKFLHYLTDLDENGAMPDDRIIYAHNGGAFDFNFVLQYIIKMTGKKLFRVEGVLPRGSSFLSIDIRRYYLDSTGEYVEGPLLSFRDSLAILPFSLKSLTEAFKTECAKGEWDHDNVKKHRKDPKLLEYLKADCVGLYQVLDKYFNWPMVKESGVSFTVASQALKIFRTTLKTRLMGCNGAVDTFVRKGYFGGRTEIFRPYFITEFPLYHRMLKEGDKWTKAQWEHYDTEMEKNTDRLDCWDINSLYPSVMRDFEFPGAFKRWSYKYDPKSLGFWEADVDVPADLYVPPLGILAHIDKKTKKVTVVSDSSQGKFIFPTGKFSGVWTTAELEYAKKLGVKVHTRKGAIFHSAGHLFKDFINELYTKRKNSGKDSVDSFICKLIMNSSYGRFGLNLIRDQLVIDEGQSGVSDSCYEFETGEVINGKPVIFRFVREKKRIKSFTNVAIAAYVTSYARLRMHQHYMRHQDRLYYTDTDSAYVYYNKQMKSSYDLGDFKYEYSGAEMCSLLPKTYALSGITGLKDKKGDIIRSKAVIKGIGKEALKARKVGVSDLYNLLEGDFRRASVGPIDPLEFKVKAKFAKVRTAMRKGTFLYVQPSQVKSIKSRYDKRVIVMKNGKYDTVPIHIEDGYAPNYNGGHMNIKVSGKPSSDRFSIEYEEGAMAKLKNDHRPKRKQPLRSRKRG